MAIIKLVFNLLTQTFLWIVEVLHQSRRFYSSHVNFINIGLYTRLH